MDEPLFPARVGTTTTYVPIQKYAALEDENERLRAEVAAFNHTKRADFQVFVDMWKQRPAWYRLLYLTAQLSFKSGFLVGYLRAWAQRGGKAPSE